MGAWDHRIMPSCHHAELNAAILILATDEHGKTRINTEGFNKLTTKRKSK
jgi:hypothetical protein